MLIDINTVPNQHNLMIEEKGLKLAYESWRILQSNFQYSRYIRKPHRFICVSPLALRYNSPSLNAVTVGIFP